MRHVEEFELIIVGGGPAGLCAAMYAGRGMLKAVLLERGVPGGELLNTEWIDDYPGFEHVLGRELAQKMTAHAAAFGADIRQENVEAIARRDDGVFEVTTTRGTIYQAPTVILTAGGTPTKLEVPGELEYAGRGVSYCAVCDGAFFKGETIAVVGGGDAAVEEADYLTRYAEKVYVIHRRDEFRASKILQERLFANPKIEVIWNKRVLELMGPPAGPSVRLLEDTLTGEQRDARGDRLLRLHRLPPQHRPGEGALRARRERLHRDRRPDDDVDSRPLRGRRPARAAHPPGHDRGRATPRRRPSRWRSISRTVRAGSWESKSVSELEVVALPNGQLAENCYLIADRRTREAVIVDPGEEPAMFLAELDTRAWTLRAIWLTHAHVDHIMGVGAVAAPPVRPSISIRSTARSTTRSPSSAPGWASRSTRRRRPMSRSSRAPGAGGPVRLRGAIHAGALARERELRGARHGLRWRRAVQRLRGPDRSARAAMPPHSWPASSPSFSRCRTRRWCTAATAPTPPSAWSG